MYELDRNDLESRSNLASQHTTNKCILIPISVYKTFDKIYNQTMYIVYK